MEDVLRTIKCVITDCDGILTDGRIYFTGDGERIKSFHVHDGAAVKLLQRAGILVALVSGRESPPLAARANELSIDEFFPGSDDKIEPFETIRASHDLDPEEICYLGDDLTDLKPVRRAGFVGTVPGAADEIQRQADYITETRGGYGAFREVAELILKTRQQWESVRSAYV